MNYQVLFARAPALRWMLNSAVVAAAHTASMLLFCSMEGYAFAKKEFPGKTLMFWSLLSTMMIPGMVLLVPLFLLVSRMGLINNFGGLILPGLVGAFGVFLMKQAIQTLPTELLDAARIDGASEIGVYSKVVLPLSKPALAVLGIFSFMVAWNDFLWPLLITQSKMMRTLAVGLATLQQESMTDYGLLMAGSAVAAIPMIIVFFAYQKHFLKGITIGGLKG
ncbi:MAG: carbohydrate ABC transporter permease [Armatimonadetes bacterium]|nr:carbohydrate ABC transporter permease [Armatimonadota bacterium]